MDSHVLQEYLDKHSFRVVVKKRKNYLTYEGLQDRYAYVLKSGIIKTSVISPDGREFNLRYINNLEIVSLLRDEYSQFIDAPFNIRVESEQAELYQIDRVQFWKDINQSKNLQMYVKDYYRERLMYSMKKMQQMLMNGKFGAVCTQIYELYDTFGITTKEGLLIDFVVTNEEIAHFCGITSASSVNRMMQQLKESGAIKMQDRKILITDLDMLKDHIIL
ncbi:Crp/Fnr family transcriptional regulator [Enterococcus termitis]|uniref:Crp/Fnr family transcriptional regulator n=1 Tax=Enterococcus termitis TaxID=332950 RepID=A0A1E5H4C9_9ENTE|nr:Crp/Fnr family transcriptional regulator [Enterococcus termitis]OEG19761.1 Crp/Fnr family transcriptional regulator [Enterococcus termitis]OJG96749.1 crp/FNR family transcriptional regulator [Enterococcus termitis]